MIPQLQKETSVSAPDTTSQWSLATKLGFRFTFVYFILWAYPRAVGSLGKGIEYSNPLRTLWHQVVPWVGIHILHLTGDFREVATGSGDELYDYVLIFCIAAVAAVAALVWSWVDRKRPNYSSLYQWLRFFMRIMVTVAMISYGCNKLWWAQFPAPHLNRLIEPYGQTQPTDLLWTFMGMSRMYSVFGGIGEMLGALLLIVPQTVTLGAAITAAVMTNVLMLNVAYDVPRKIYCIHLIVLCLILMVPDVRRLLDFFVLNRTAQLSKPVPLVKEKMLNYGTLLLFIAIAAGTFWMQGKYSYDVANDAMKTLPAPVRGIWTVNQFTIDGISRPALITDQDRWRRVVLDTPYEFDIQPMDGPLHRYLLLADIANKKLSVQKPNAKSRPNVLFYNSATPDTLILHGSLDGHQVDAELSRLSLSDPVNFALTNRGFHWINPYMNWSNELQTWH